jgi:hypothetical protein
LQNLLCEIAGMTGGLLHQRKNMTVNSSLQLPSTKRTNISKPQQKTPKSIAMTKTITYEVQTTLDAYLKELTRAIGHMDYEIRGNRVVAHSPEGTVVINLTYEGKRHLGSLNLPMTNVEIAMVGFTDDAAQAFLKHYDECMLRTGG